MKGGEELDDLDRYFSAILSGRRNGKTTLAIEALKAAVTRGEHVHMCTRDGLRCVDGPDDCTAERRTIEQAERELRRAR